jgi:hypothetical protein
MDSKDKPEPKPVHLGNESTDPFSPTLPPGSLHEMLRPEEEVEEENGGEPAEQKQRPEGGADR